MKKGDRVVMPFNVACGFCENCEKGLTGFCGAGPVGLMAAQSAFLKDAARIFVVDAHDDRLGLAQSLGGIPIDMRKGDPVKHILDQTDGLGTDRGCECVGYQCCERHGHEVSNYTMNCLVGSTKATGGIGVVGVFVPKDPDAPDDLQKEGKMAFDFGSLWFKGQTIKTGQCNVKAYNRRLAKLIEAGRTTPSKIISHRLKLDEAPDAYRHFDARDAGWTKVLLKPAA